MQQTLQPAGSRPQSGTPVAVGEFQNAETRLECVPHRADSQKKDDELHPEADHIGAGKTAGSTECDPGGACSVAARVLILLIRFYQKGISPWLPPSCRFTPSCSQYGIEAVQTHGFFKGSILTVWRILRCQPLCKGGYDPVPQRKTSAQAAYHNRQK